MESMKGYQCTECGRIFYPCRQLCLQCGGRELQEVPLSEEATLVTFTKLHALTMDFATRTLMLGIVEFAHGARALGQLSTDQVEMGMKMRSRWEVVREMDGEPVYGLKFYPAPK
jgi:uncharacterized OB-fold protein